MTPGEAPRTTKVEATIPALAATVPGDQTVGEVPFDANITGVTFIPEGNITGATATKRTFTLVNKGLDGNGAVVAATLDFVTGVNADDFDELAFTLGVAANLVVADGEVLAVVETVTATGTANPGGKIVVELVNR